MSLCHPCAKKVSTCCPDRLRQLPDPLVVSMLTELARYAWRHCFLKRPPYNPALALDAWRQKNGWCGLRHALNYAQERTTAVLAANNNVLPEVVATQKSQTEVKLAGWKLAGYTW